MKSFVRSKHAVLCVPLAAIFTLVGCGSDGGESGPTTPGPTTTTTSTTISTPAGTYACNSDLELTDVVQLSQKGMALDDTTFANCSDKMTVLWPHSAEKVTSLRIFTPWRPIFGDAVARELAWARLASFVKSNNLKVLIGQDVTCSDTADDVEWALNMQLMKRLGKDHIMGVAIGNEMDIFYQKQPAQEDPGCIKRLWDGGRYWRDFQRRVAELDANGFDDVPVTVVWAGSILGSTTTPFVNTAQARVNDFMTNTSKTYGKRWIFSATIYPIWDTSVLPAPWMSGKTCQDIITFVTDMQRYNGAVTYTYRHRIQSLTGKTDDTFWLAETGWSSPSPSALGPHCADYTSLETLRKYYSNFLSWNMTSVKDANSNKTARGPDHAFYFTMRDSSNFAFEEHFGLIKSCNDMDCKISPPARTFAV